MRGARESATPVSDWTRASSSSQSALIAALGVDDIHRALQCVHSDRPARQLLHLGLELVKLGAEQRLGVLVLGVRQIEDIEVPHETFQHFVGFLLSVARVFADHKVARLQVGAHAAELEAEG